jgi:hypothetical protein
VDYFRSSPCPRSAQPGWMTAKGPIYSTVKINHKISSNFRAFF